MKTSQVFGLGGKPDPMIWLTLGSCLQLILVTFLPSKVAMIPVATMFLYQILKSTFSTEEKLSNPNGNMDGVLQGRYTALLPSQDGSGSQKGAAAEVVVFAIGATCNHAEGQANPGYQKILEYFGAMWKDIEVDPEKWGFLGRTRPMVDLTPGAGAPSVTLSYWKDLPSLYAFAHSQSHRDVWDWWNSNLKGGRIPHLGIFHEVYAVPKGHWENIYVNYRPFGMGQMKIPAGDGEEAFRSVLVPAKGSLRSVLGRMDRSEDIKAVKAQ